MIEFVKLETEYEEKQRIMKEVWAQKYKPRLFPGVLFFDTLFGRPYYTSKEEIQALTKDYEKTREAYLAYKKKVIEEITISKKEIIIKNLLRKYSYRLELCE